MIKRYYLMAELSYEDHDLVVDAESPEQAVELWREHYEIDEDDEFADVQRIFELPALSAKPQPLSWGSDLKQVGGSKT